MEGAEPTAGPGSSMISFGDVVIDLINYELTRAGDPVPVEPQVFDVLQYLIEHRDRVVSKEELFDNVWGDRFVSESALTSRIKSARQAVGDDGRRQEVIRTTHGRGYRFVAEVVPSPAGDAGAGAGAGDEDVIDLNASEAAGVHGPVSGVPERRVPVPSRPLVARDRELAALTGLLAANRLVTVVGPGGVGKTRLATEVAAHWDQEPVDVISFVALAAVAGPDEVLIAVRDALGIGSAPSVDAIGAIREAMAGKSALLVLDNFEHVVDAATKLVDLVESVPGLRLLVTSRERLGLAGEQVLELEPFSLHTDGSAESSAVTFFQHAVRGVGADIDLTADHHRDAQAICQTLDGLPLAMELAAAQTRYYSLSYLRSHLDSAAITVADRARDRPERHHTMQSTMAWSYRLLTPKQQNLLASLSVFKGSWPLTAADAIAGVDEPGAAAHDLMALVDKSLVRRSAGAAGEPRFMMLGLLRDFAGAQLEASGAREDASRRHAEIMAETVRVLEAGRWGDAGDSWIEAISAEYPDAVKALNWCFSGGDPAIGRQIVSALGFWWYRTGRLGEGRVWVDKALASATAPDDSATDDTTPSGSAVDDSAMAWIHSAAGTLAAYELR
ncbi:MAG: winged helix-turn-helix domain-containing protein, partial [Actinomycetota bacterium]